MENKDAIYKALVLSRAIEAIDIMETDTCTLAQVRARMESLGSLDPVISNITSKVGVPMTLAIELVSLININRSVNLSSLWRYAGCEEALPGRTFHQGLKRICLRIAEFFIQNPGPYKNRFDEMMNEYTIKYTLWDQQRCHNAARRRLIKLFLKHLWIYWQSQENVSEAITRDDRKELERYGW